MRRSADGGTARAALVVAVALFLALGAPTAAQSGNVLSNGGFEDGSSGWSTPTNATLTADDTDPVHSGSMAGRLTADAAGDISVSSQYWWAPIDALEEYTLSIHVHAGDEGISGAAARLEAVDGDGLTLASVDASAGSGTGWVSITTDPVRAPALAEYVVVVVSATATSAGAVLHIDSAVVAAAEPEPPPAATETATATATATPTTTATPTPTATAAPTTAATPTATPTAAPRPRPEPTATVPPAVEETSATGRTNAEDAPYAHLVPDAPPPGAPARRPPAALLRNGDFEAPEGLEGWRARGGVARADESTPGSSVAVLTSRTTATKWLYQVAPVTPGEWYEAGAWLQPRDDAERALVRVAWYASRDGSGRQLATVDSPTVPGGAVGLVGVTTGAVQAPPTARSAQVRLMLRSHSSALATLVADDAYFEPTSAPAPEPAESPRPSATPEASPTAVATPSPDPTATPAATMSPTPAPTPAATPSPEPADAPAATPSPVPAATPAATPSPTPAPTSIPEATASPTASATTSRTASPTPQPTPGSVLRVAAMVTPVATPLPAAPAPPVGESLPRLTAYHIPLRITALLPDPVEPGPDARFEWIEVTNVGRSALRLAGLELRDNAATLALPDVELPAGGSIVVAGEAADVGDAIAVRVDGGLFNGLANAGDRVVLLTTEGAVVDSLSYGDDSSGFGPPLAAPASGEELRRRFATSGALVGVQVGSRGRDGPSVVAPATSTPATATRAVAASATPTVGARVEGVVAPPSPTEDTSVREPDRAPGATATEPAFAQEGVDDAGAGVNRAAWVALASVALGALAGVGVFRVRELMGA